ncbi:restriction endonuclease subunit S [Bacillus sp. S10(2024)]|uniref:restriction endonuclease subunit S n=1 Tax=Bacillus sp. S10(2024) TaxID=3162886 RepID=UPI003D226825
MSNEKKIIEEILDAALVPKEEQPYAVPQNWRWVRLGTIGEIGSSKRVLKSSWESKGVPFYRAREIVRLNKKEEIENGIFISEELYLELKSKYGVPKMNDLLITGVGTIGETYIVNSEEKFYFKDGNVIWFKNKFNLNIKYINYYLKSEFAKSLIKKMSAGTTVDTYTISNANKTLIPLAPIFEQKRIVEKVERLLDKIEEAKQLIEEAKETFELRRAAILDMAFRGELTRKWRVQNGCSNVEELVSQIQKNLKKKEIPISFTEGFPNKWCSVKLGDISKITMGQSPKGDTYNDVGNGTPLINGPVEFGPKAFSKTKMIKWTTSPTKMCEEGDLLICVRGSTTGRMNIAGFKACIGRGVAAISSPLVQEFLNFKINSIQSSIYNLGTGSTFPNVSSDKLNNIEIALPPKEEIEEIIRLLKKMLNCMEKEKKQLENIDNEIEAMKQAILSKAFRGELGTNDPSEENAIELLKEILKS